MTYVTLKCEHPIEAYNFINGMRKAFREAWVIGRITVEDDAFSYDVVFKMQGTYVQVMRFGAVGLIATDGCSGDIQGLHGLKPRPFESALLTSLTSIHKTMAVRCGQVHA